MGEVADKDADRFDSEFSDAPADVDQDAARFDAEFGEEPAPAPVPTAPAPEPSGLDHLLALVRDTGLSFGEGTSLGHGEELARWGSDLGSKAYSALNPDQVPTERVGDADPGGEMSRRATSSPGGKAVRVLGGLTTAIPAAVMAGPGVATQAALGGALGGIAAHGSGESMLGGVAAGGALGGLGGAAGGLAQKAGSYVNPVAAREMAELAKYRPQSIAGAVMEPGNALKYAAGTGAVQAASRAGEAAPYLYGAGGAAAKSGGAALGDEGLSLLESLAGSVAQAQDRPHFEIGEGVLSEPSPNWDAEVGDARMRTPSGWDVETGDAQVKPRWNVEIGQAQSREPAPEWRIDIGDAQVSSPQASQEWAVQRVLYQGNSGLPPDAERRLTEAAMSGDPDKLATQSFLLSGKYPRFADALQRQRDSLLRKED